MKKNQQDINNDKNPETFYYDQTVGQLTINDSTIQLDNEFELIRSTFYDWIGSK